MISFSFRRPSLLAVGLTTVSVLSGINVSSAQGATLDTSGVWSSVNGGTNLEGVNTNQISWGNLPGGSRSSYVFTGVSGETITLPPSGGSSPLFELGDFTHNNFVIPSGTSITGATLDVDFSLTNGTPVNQMFSFDFLHNETPNVQPPPGPACSEPPGSIQPCPDIVSFLNNGESSQTITINGEEFSLFIEGFRTSPGEPLVNDFITLENQSNTATLFARLAKPSTTVPEPGTFLGLLAVGGLGLSMKRKKHS